jgi:glycosyltransferase involved in cell wall biosynthesis
MTSAVIAIDDQSHAYFTRRYPEAMVHRIPIAIDVGHFRPADREAERLRWGLAGRPTVLFVGRLAREKDPALAADTFRSVIHTSPQAVLLVAGTGPLHEPFIRLRNEVGPDRVRLLGFVAREDLPSLYTAADVLLLTSNTEQIPTVVLESLACGTPVVSTRVGEVDRILDDPTLGSVCDRSCEVLARAILERIEESRGDRAAHEGVRRAAAGCYSWEQIGPRFVEVLRAAFT